MRINQNSQLASERTEVLRISKIGSLSTKLLSTISEKKFIANNDTPKNKPANIPFEE